MTLNYGSRQIGEVRAGTVHGFAGLGASQLRFNLSWNLHPKRDHVFTVFGTSIWISARPEGESEWRILGHALPETAWSDECRDCEPFERPLLYRLTLPDSQLLAIEDARKGKGLSFQLEVRGNVHGPEGIRSLDSIVTVAVNASDWARILKEAHAAEVLLVGAHLPVGDPKSKCRAAIDLVRKANEHLLNGHYDDAVAQCRRSIESLWKALNVEQLARTARKSLVAQKDRVAMTKLDRELAIGEALRNLTHSAHHVGVNAEPEIFGRRDAAFMVAATAGLVSALAGMPERMAQPVIEGQPVVITPPVAKAPPPTAKDADALLAARIARIQENLAASPPRTFKSLRTAVHEWLSKKLDSKELDALMEELKRQKVVVEVGGKPTYPNLKK